MRHTIPFLETTCRVLALAALTVLLAQAAAAQADGVPVDPDASTLSYTGHHPLHAWTGTSGAVEGRLHVDPAHPERSRIEIVVPVASFDSGNGSRDSNMLDVVEADAYPDVRFTAERITVDRWEATADGYAGRWRVHGPLTFHGRTIPVEIPVDVTIDGTTFTAHGTFGVSLSAFDVHRPKLLLMPVHDEIDVEGTLQASLGSGA